MRDLFQITVVFIIIMLFSCFTCVHKPEEQSIGFYEKVEGGILTQLEVTEEGHFIFHKLITADTLIYQCDTTDIINSNSDGKTSLQFTNFNLVVEFKSDHIAIFDNNEQILSKLSDTTQTQMPKGKWRLHSVDGQIVIAENVPVLEFEGDNMAVYFGCNRGRGKFIKSGSLGKVKGLISTRMACLDMRMEQLLTEVLNNNFIVEESQDSLIVKSKKYFIFTRS